MANPDDNFHFPTNHYTRIILALLLHEAMYPNIALAKDDRERIIAAAKRGTEKEAVEVINRELMKKATIYLSEADDWTRLTSLTYRLRPLGNEGAGELDVTLGVMDFHPEQQVAFSELRLWGQDHGLHGRLAYSSKGINGPVKVDFEGGTLITGARKPLLSFLETLLAPTSPLTLHPSTGRGMRSLGFLIENA